jgi:hypothetical protein
MTDYRPNGTITVDGVAYEIDAVDISCSTENGHFVVATRVRTRPLTAEIDITITKRTLRGDAT